MKTLKIILIALFFVGSIWGASLVFAQQGTPEEEALLADLQVVVADLRARISALLLQKSTTGAIQPAPVAPPPALTAPPPPPAATRPAATTGTTGSQTGGGTGIITGGGTVGAIPQFMGATVIGDSIITQNDFGAVIIRSTLGIGAATITPAVLSVSNESSKPSIWIEDIATTTTNPDLVVINNRVGIGTGVPQSRLHVVGPSVLMSSIQITNTAVNSRGWSLRHLGNGNIFAVTNNFSNSDTILIDNGGTVGIGGLPTAGIHTSRLHVAGGDLSISGGRGLILRAFDGPNCFLVRVNNAGILVSSATSICP